MAGDALDSVLSEIDAQAAQQQAQRRVPAPRPPAPVVSGRAASPTPPEGGPSFLTRIANIAQNIVAPGSAPSDDSAGVGAGILRSPVTAAAGLADFAGDVGHAVAGPRGDVRNYEGHISHSGLSFRYAPQNAESISQFASDIDPLSRVGNPTANETASNIASLAVGYGAGSALAKFTGVTPKIEQVVQAFGNPVARATAGLAVRAGGASLVDGMVMDPETDRFSNILQNMGIHTEFTDWLAHDDKEGHLAGRFKNAVEGLGLGAATDGILNAAGYWRARLRGDNATADQIQGELAAKHEGEVPDYITKEVPPEAAKSPEPAYVGGWEDAEDGSIRPVYEKDPTKTAEPEQKAQLADDGGSTPPPAPQQQQAPAAGTDTGDEPLPPIMAGKGSTGGPVRPMDPKDIARAMGENPDDIISFNVKKTPDDPGVTVGPVQRGSIQALANDIKGWRDMAAEGDNRELDITRNDLFGPSDRIGEFRLGNIGSADKVAPLLRSLVDRLPDQGVRSDADLMKDASRAAAEVGEDPASMLEAARLISGKLSDADTAMATLRTVWKRAAGDLDGVADTDWENASEEDAQQAAQRIYNMMAISGHVQNAKAGLGRGLRVNQLPDADSYLNTVAKADRAPDGTFGPDGPLPRTRQEIQNWFDVWKATKDDPKLRSDMLEGQLTRSIPSPGTYLRRSFPNFFTAAILSAVRTHMLGFTGPVLMSVLRNTERLSGGMLAAVGNPFLSKSAREANWIAAHQASFNYLQTVGDVADVLHWAGKSMGQNKTQLGSGLTFDASNTTGRVSPELAEAAKFNPGAIGYRLGAAINAFPRVISRLYNGTDELTQRLAYYGEVRARAIVAGAQQGLEGDDLGEFVRQRLKESVNENPDMDNLGVGGATDPDALRAAQRNSFLGPVGSDGTGVRRLADFINGLRHDYPEMRYLLPVFNVPANILGEIIKRTPLAYIPGFGADQTIAALRGELGPIEQAEAHGRMLSGAAFLTGGLMLTRAGLLTGAGPQEGTARKVWLQTHEPYSLRVGDNWVRLDRYDVMGGLLTIPATVADATQFAKQDEKVSDLLMGGVGALAEWFKDKASLRTASELMELGDDPTQNVGNQLTRMGGDIVAGELVPNVVQSLVTQQLDKTLRLKRSWADYLKAAVPGLSRTLPPVRNVLGEPVERAADTLGEAIFPVTIAPAVTYKTDPVIDEIDRLYHSTGYAAGADPNSLGYGFFHPQDVTLENGQSLYDAFMQARQTMTVNGLTLRQSLGKLFASPEYNAAVDADPGQKVTSRGDASRGYMVEQTVNLYNKRIKAELADASPVANRWLTAAAAKQRDDAYLKDVSAEDLAKNPDYYQSHGIDGSVYSAKVREGSTGALVAALQQR